MNILFLDDERMPSQVTWVDFPRDHIPTIVRNYMEFVEHITMNGIPDFVCFDHDLAAEHYVAMHKEVYGGLDALSANYGSEKTGYDCAKWLVQYCDENNIKFPDFVVHSMNPIGKERIEQYISEAKKHLGI